MKIPENTRIDQLDRKGFTFSYVKDRIEKEQVRQKLQSFASGRMRRQIKCSRDRFCELKRYLFSKMKTPENMRIH